METLLKRHKLCFYKDPIRGKVLMNMLAIVMWKCLTLSSLSIFNYNMKDGEQEREIQTRVRIYKPNEILLYFIFWIVKNDFILISKISDFAIAFVNNFCLKKFNNSFQAIIKWSSFLNIFLLSISYLMWKNQLLITIHMRKFISFLKNVA